METSPDREDSRSLFITIHQPFSGHSLTKVRARPIMSAKFVFDDYIRCMSAKQRLQRRRLMLKQHKLHCIAQLLELPAMATPPSHYYSITPPTYINLGQQQRPTITTHQRAPNQEAPPTEARPIIEEQKTLGAAGDSQPSHIQGHFGPTMAAPEQCLSPSRSTSSQAQALASVLRQSPPPDDNLESGEAFAPPRPQRAESVEEAVEALEMEMEQLENGHSYAAKSNNHVTKDDTIKDCVTSLARTSIEEETCSTPGTGSTSSSRPGTRSQSLENLARCSSFSKPTSMSAPASPRGARHPPPVDPSEYENVARLAAVNSMSEPTLFIEESLKEAMDPISAVTPRKKDINARRKNPRQRKGRNRKR